MRRRADLARWGLQENQLKHGVERWGINHLDGRRVEEYPADALVPNPARRRLERVLKLSHTAEGEAWRKLARASPDDPARAQYEHDARAAMEHQRELMALRATVPAVAPVSETPLAGKLRRHELGYKNVLDTLRTALANLESDLAVLLSKHLDRPREAKKLLATLFAAPGAVHVGSRALTVRLMPAATDSERVALRAFLADVARRRLCTAKPQRLSAFPAPSVARTAAFGHHLRECIDRKPPTRLPDGARHEQIGRTAACGSPDIRRVRRRRLRNACREVHPGRGIGRLRCAYNAREDDDPQHAKDVCGVVGIICARARSYADLSCIRWI